MERPARPTRHRVLPFSRSRVADPRAEAATSAGAQCEDGESPLHVQIAYGTSRKTLDKYSGEFTIGPDDGAVFIQTGLTVATKFDLARLVWLPYDSHWFKPRTGAGASKTPKLGYLDAGKTLSIRRRFEASGRAAGLI